MRIECTDCEMYGSGHCDDCLVGALLHPEEGVVEIDDELESSLQALSGAGLIPVLRFRPRDPAASPPAGALEGPAAEVAEAG